MQKNDNLWLNNAILPILKRRFFYLNLSISNRTVTTKTYDKRDDFDVVNFRFLDGDVSRRTSNGVYISQLIRFARASSNASDFSCRNKALPPISLGKAIVIINFDSSPTQWVGGKI